MALQAFGNQHGMLLVPFEPQYRTNSASTSTADATGESAAVIGHLLLSTGPGTSATISAAGSGKIHVLLGAITFNNGGTNLRVGVNDVGATGLEDGTFDVYADLTGGGGGLTASVVNALTMTVGTKTITHGDLVAIVAEMTAKGGADSVVVGTTSVSTSTPYGTADTGSGPAKLSGNVPLLGIQFDNGVIGWMDGVIPYIRNSSSAAFASNSTPDEYALVFRLPVPSVAVGLTANLTSLAATDDFELILYSDPLGTPVAERTIAQDMDLAATGEWYSRPFTSAYSLLANTDYAIALRPTTTNTIQLFQMKFGTGGANLRKATALSTDWSMYTRTNQTGAFANQDLTILPMLGVWLQQFSDNTFSGIIGGS